MTTISTTAIVALMTVSVGLAAASPAMAQHAQPRFQHHLQHQGDGTNNHGDNLRPRRNGAGPGGLLAFGRDSERLEIALVRLAHRIDLTDEQKALLERFKTAALAAQADFAGIVDASHPAPPAAGAPRAQWPDIVARLDRRIALEKAHVAALTAVQPSFHAFVASLTDEQNAQLMPQHNRRTGWQGEQRKGPMGQHGHRPMPGQFNTQIEGPGAPAGPAPAPLKS